MSFLEYVKDRCLTLIGYAGMDAGVGILLYLFKSNQALTVSVLGILVFVELLLTGYDYARRKKFYDDFLQKLERLDQKYLITEVMERPDFLEGELLYHALYQVDKSMHEQVNRYRYSMKNFKDYIELWIHEVKLPIASLLLILHNDHPECAGRMKEQIRRIENDVDQVLYFARGENAEKDYRIRRISLSNIISRTLAGQKDQFLYRHIRLETRDLETEVLTDAKWMEFITGQILSNSLKYLKEDGTEPGKIEIFATKEPSLQEVSLHLKDNGIGIPAEDISRVFDKSFTGKNGRTVSSSTGMGLYLCRKLCSKMGHQIQVFSQEGSYTEFVISFRENGLYDVLKEEK